MKSFKPSLPDPEFDQFWIQYPKKLAKGDARKAWQQTASIRPDLPKLLQAVITAKAMQDWLRDGGMYIPYPATWLRGERWEDVHEIDIVRTVNGKAWWETVTGTDARAKELKIVWVPLKETYQQFAARVRAESELHKVIPLREPGQDDEEIAA